MSASSVCGEPKNYTTQEDVSLPPVVDHITQTSNIRSGSLEKCCAEICLLGSNSNEAYVCAAVAGLRNATTAEQNYFLDNPQQFGTTNSHKQSDWHCQNMSFYLHQQSVSASSTCEPYLQCLFCSSE
jgi:hypothetical protein